MNLPTVFAVSTAPGRAGLAVIRVTGGRAATVLEELTGKPLPSPRMASRRMLYDREGELIDDALVIYFAGPASFTGEDVVELHCHGGRAVTAALLSAIAGLNGVDPAEPGEFTRRAFLNGKLDLAEIEALGDLLAAETEAQRLQAVQAASGTVRDRIALCREKLLQALALVEATIDWADEEVPEDVSPTVIPALSEAMGTMRALLDGAAARERLREGFEVALLGAPNAGKSSLINMIAGREVALATPVSGTTRDIIEARLDLRGLPVTLIDTAGLRESENMVEQLGIARAQERAAKADLRIFVDAPDAPLPEEAAALWRAGDLRISNKSDLARGPHLPVSAITGAGVDAVLGHIAMHLSDMLPTTPGISHARQQAALSAALRQAEHAAAAFGTVGMEIVAEYLRSALMSLERLAGRTSPEDVLSEVFSRFCLGK